MPSYAQTVKDELARIFDEDENCLRAELAAMLKVGTVLNEGRLEFSTLNAAVARKVIKLLNKFYPAAKREVATIRTKGIAKRLRYFVRIFLTGVVDEFFQKADSPEIVPDDFARVAYLRGAFMATGTINKPESSYYLEIISSSESAANFVRQILKDLDFRPSKSLRKNILGNYICEGDAIEDFLGMVGADETLERFQIVRNLKEVRANVNRLVNVETANLNKMIDAAQRQIADIKILLKHNVKLKEDFQQTLEMRLQFPEYSVGELAEKLFVTRQALNYRFKIMHKLAQEILAADKP